MSKQNPQDVVTCLFKLITDKQKNIQPSDMQVSAFDLGTAVRKVLFTAEPSTLVWVRSLCRFQG